MSLSELFIRRPITTTLIMLGIGVFGVMAYRRLPVSDLPERRFPDHPGPGQPAGSQPGNDGRFGRHAAGEAVLDGRRSGFDDVDQSPRATRTSRCSSCWTATSMPPRRTCRAIIAAVRAAAAGHARAAAYQKVNPADQAILFMGALLRPRCRCQVVDEYAETLIAPRISTVNGVAQVNVYGAAKYAVRIQLDPRKLAAHGDRHRRGRQRDRSNTTSICRPALCTGHNKPSRCRRTAS